MLPTKYQGVSFDRPPIADMARDPLTRDRGGDRAARTPRISTATSPRVAGSGSRARRHGQDDPGDAGLQAGDRGRYSAAIYSLPRLLARIRRTYDGEAGELSYLELLPPADSVDLLHIDDLGAEKRSDWVLEQLYAIVDERYASNRSIVVTTNLDHERLKEQIGERTVSRLARDVRAAADARRRSPLGGLSAPA